ncbi:hypothetical protein K2173_020251 [Erythroxylum novogranatense]|uniref:Protein kinase domain-containing protein n=1 Tax=Erythroxylum novogranatense TaxID=1862640 RepID=A0AAV8U7B2_9ROSI|nr:hypothetical protein K2173_020251 [Erythroxylum novogranatense]
MLPNWKKPHINLILLSTVYIIFRFVGSSCSKEGVNGAPVSSNDYKQHQEVGEGVGATVYRALCIPLNEIVAIKVLDLEKCNSDLDGTRHEVQTMTLIDHPNVLRAHCSFSTGHNLCVVMPYIDEGSCFHIMKSAYPEGFEEPDIATLLRAGNILVDSNGAVKLADFGVSACMFDTGDRQHSRNTFVGTLCWIASEVMQQLNILRGIPTLADIWSIGITALKLAHGHVLLITLQNAPPGLTMKGTRDFQRRSFKELVGACLVKDPKKHPSSEKLLKHHFFKQARSNEYAKEADLLVQNKALYGDKEQLSEQELIGGISAWSFNIEDLKNQAAFIFPLNPIIRSCQIEIIKGSMCFALTTILDSITFIYYQSQLNHLNGLHCVLQILLKPKASFYSCDQDAYVMCSINRRAQTQRKLEIKLFLSGSGRLMERLTMSLTLLNFLIW